MKRTRVIDHMEYLFIIIFPTQNCGVTKRTTGRPIFMSHIFIGRIMAYNYPTPLAWASAFKRCTTNKPTTGLFAENETESVRHTRGAGRALVHVRTVIVCRSGGDRRRRRRRIFILAKYPRIFVAPSRSTIETPAAGCDACVHFVLYPLRFGACVFFLLFLGRESNLFSLGRKFIAARLARHRPTARM